MNKTEQHIIIHALEHLQNTTGVRTKFTPAVKDKFIDGTVDFIMKDKKTLFFIEAKRELRTHHLPAITEQAIKYNPLLVIAETIFPKLKEELRKQNIAYLDDAGNAYINYHDLVILIDGKKNEKKAYKLTNRAFTKAGLKVVFHLLLDEELINLPYRELAKMAEVGLGNINNVMTGLKDMGYVLQLDNKRKKLQKKNELLDRWMNGFAEILKPALHVGNFRFAKTEEFNNWRKIRVEGQDTIWGGEPAGDILTDDLNPANLTIYTTKKKADIMKQFKAVPDPGGKIKVYQKFWNHPAQWKKAIAPPLLVYVDLILTGDPRCQEIAKKIFDRHLKNEFI
ncbi:MAG: type IV toxin-antitoxin system AbiEi family antitoxin [Ferruginibacter sp.]